MSDTEPPATREQQWILKAVIALKKMDDEAQRKLRETLPRAMAECRYCGRGIYWTHTLEGERVLLDAEPQSKATFVMVTPDGYRDLRCLDLTTLPDRVWGLSAGLPAYQLHRLRCGAPVRPTWMKAMTPRWGQEPTLTTSAYLPLPDARVGDVVLAAVPSEEQPAPMHTPATITAIEGTVLRCGRQSMDLGEFGRVRVLRPKEYLSPLDILFDAGAAVAVHRAGCRCYPFPLIDRSKGRLMCQRCGVDWKDRLRRAPTPRTWRL